MWKSNYVNWKHTDTHSANTRITCSIVEKYCIIIFSRNDFQICKFITHFLMSFDFLNNIGFIRLARLQFANSYAVCVSRTNWTQQEYLLNISKIVSMPILCLYLCILAHRCSVLTLEPKCCYVVVFPLASNGDWIDSNCHVKSQMHLRSCNINKSSRKIESFSSFSQFEFEFLKENFQFFAIKLKKNKTKSHINYQIFERKVACC